MKLFPGLSLALIIGIVVCCNISIGQDIPEITSEDIPGFSLDRNECFDGGSLWGYMNGGADIYLEYGFEILRVEEFSNEEETIKLELYKMANPVSAFGIYSIKTFKCKQSNTITTIDCLNPYQFQLLYGEYYIQLINESGSTNAKQTMISIAETLLNKIEPVELILPLTYLTDSLNLSFSELKMVKGELGVHNKVMYLEDCFKGIEDFQVYYAKKIEDGKKVKYYECIFDQSEMKNKFLENNNNLDLNIIWEEDNKVLIKQ